MPFDPNTPRSRDEVLLQAIVSGDSSAMGDPRDREEEFVKAIADKETLPDYSEASNGDVLQIGTDGPEWGTVPNELPAIAAGDAGKVLKVNSGETGVEWGTTGGGGKKYLHNIELINSSGPSYYHFSFVNDVATAYTNQGDAIKALFALVGEHEYIATGFTVRTVIYAIAPKALGTFTAYGASIAISNNALSFTNHDDWGVSVTTLTCNDLVYEV